MKVTLDNNDVYLEICSRLIEAGKPDLDLALKLTNQVCWSQEFFDLEDEIEELTFRKMREIISRYIA